PGRSAERARVRGGLGLGQHLADRRAGPHRSGDRTGDRPGRRQRAPHARGAGRDRRPERHRLDAGEPPLPPHRQVLAVDVRGRLQARRALANGTNSSALTVSVADTIRIGPVSASSGTKASTSEGDTTTKGAGTPPNWTNKEPPRLVPWMRTRVPGGPPAGSKPVMAGRARAGGGPGRGAREGASAGAAPPP